MITCALRRVYHFVASTIQAVVTTSVRVSYYSVTIALAVTSKRQQLDTIYDTAADCPLYAAVDCRRPSFPRRRCSCLERSAAAACHVCNITVCLPQPPEDISVGAAFYQCNRHSYCCAHESSTGPAEHLLRTRPLQIWQPLISL